MYKKIMPFLPMAVAPLVVLAWHQLSISLGVYSVWRWFDTPMHFLGGASIAISSHFFLQYIDKSHVVLKTKVIKIFLSLAFVALAATMWELAEYCGQYLTGIIMQPSVYDTMKDLSLGLLGGVLTSYVITILERK